MSWADKYSTKQKFKKLQRKKKKTISGKVILWGIILFMIGDFVWWYISSNPASPLEDASFVDMDGYCYHYQQLQEEQKRIYESLYLACSNYEGEVLITDIIEKDCKRVWTAFRYDHPEFFWLEDVKYWKKGGFVNRISFSVPKDVKEQKRMVDSAADAFLVELPDDPYEKIKTIYERIIYHTDYKKGVPNEQDVRSVLLGGKSVCGGYSKTFLYLCDKAGIPCGYVEGDIIGRDLHAWNFVKIDDAYYWVDVTWGDPNYEYYVPDALREDISYEYLCVNDDVILVDRLLSNNPASSIYDADCVFEYPTCRSNRIVSR